MSNQTISVSHSKSNRAAGKPSNRNENVVSPREGGLLWTRGITKNYRKGSVTIAVLRGVDLTVREAEFLTIIGQSGCGKSTLLHLLGTLDRPDAGEIHFAGRRIDRLSATEKDTLRNKAFGMIFQLYHLLPELSTLENVLLPNMISYGVWGYWKNRRAAQNRAKHVLDLVGMHHRLRHKPRELSGGEMQRVAIARSLMANPRLLLADEPTGNLDRQTSNEIMELLQSLNHDHKLTIVMVTHDLALADKADRIVRLHEGQVETASRPGQQVA